MKTPLWIPFSAEGMLDSEPYLLHYPNVGVHVKLWKNGRETFKETLTYNKYWYLRSGVTVLWTDPRGVHYPMIGRYFFELVHLLHKGSLHGTWGYIKRGQTYSLVYNG